MLDIMTGYVYLFDNPLITPDFNYSLDYARIMPDFHQLC